MTTQTRGKFLVTRAVLVGKDVDRVASVRAMNPDLFEELVARIGQSRTRSAVVALIDDLRSNGTRTSTFGETGVFYVRMELRASARVESELDAHLVFSPPKRIPPMPMPTRDELPDFGGDIDDADFEPLPPKRDAETDDKDGDAGAISLPDVVLASRKFETDHLSLTLVEGTATFQTRDNDSALVLYPVRLGELLALVNTAIMETGK